MQHQHSTIFKYTYRNSFGNIEYTDNDAIFKQYIPNFNRPFIDFFKAIIERHYKIRDWNNKSYKELDTGNISVSNTFTATDVDFKEVNYTRIGKDLNLRTVFDTIRDPITKNLTYLYDIGIEINVEQNKFTAYVTNVLDCRLEISGPLDFLQKNLMFDK